MKNNNMHVHASEEQGDDGGVVDTMIDSVDHNPNDEVENNTTNLNWEEDIGVELDKEMWFQRDPDEDLLSVQNAFINYEDFPYLPDFPCISSSSSSSSCSSAPVLPSPQNPHKTSSSSNTSSSSSASSSSVTSWVHHKQMGAPDQALLSTGSGSFEVPREEHDGGNGNRHCSNNYMDVMEELGGMELLDPDDIWDPSSLFPCDALEGNDFGKEVKETEAEPNDEDSQQKEKPSEDLGMLFFEWLKSNKESISAEDLRSIKLKRTTIECAANRLGGGREGIKQLLKLILEWVQNHQLQKKRIKEEEKSSFPNPNHNPSFSRSLDLNPNPYLVPSMPQWVPHQTYIPESTSIYPPMMYGYMGEPVYNNNGAIPVSPTSLNNQPLLPPTWPPPPHHYTPSTAVHHYAQYPDQNLSSAPPPPSQIVPPLHPRPFTPFGNPYQNQLYPSPGDRLVRLGSSATKEARKKRMARQKRFFSHSRSHNQHHQEVNETRLANDTTCTTTDQHPNWLYWPSSPSATASPSAMLVSDSPPPPPPPPPLLLPPPHGDGQTAQPQQYQRQVPSDRRQMHGCKPGAEKNLKFLLQKVLKQSDVGNLGRIVLPKKEAETYLPGLEARDGISIAMEDIGTSRIWNMRYRFWPNNKSRMYLLENTGEFVRSNGLQEGDFIVIYSDIKCGKYLIRGVRVRQPGSKSEAKKQGKAHRNIHSSSTAGMASTSSSTKEAVR